MIVFHTLQNVVTNGKSPPLRVGEYVINKLENDGDKYDY